jgi:hypothetical protein
LGIDQHFEEERNIREEQRREMIECGENHVDRYCSTRGPQLKNRGTGFGKDAVQKTERTERAE